MKPRFFCMINGTPRNVPTYRMKFYVDGEMCAVAGTWRDGRPWRPDGAQFRAALPFRWRAAFDRDSTFWHDKLTGQSRIALHDRRGKYLATIYCNLAES